MPAVFFYIRAVSLPVALSLLGACHQAEQTPIQGQRIALDEVPSQGEQPSASPDTKSASWFVSGDGQALNFGIANQRPFLTLACNVKTDPAQVTIIRHVPARPGEKALFPVVGNATISRFKVDATLADHEWRWQGVLSADDAQLEVFERPSALEATLPGGGTLKIPASGIPGQFIGWCRDRGQSTPVAAPKDGEAAKPAA